VENTLLPIRKRVLDHASIFADGGNDVPAAQVVLPTGAGTDLRLRTVSRPENHLAIVLDRLGLVLPGHAKRIGNVVEKIGPKIDKPQQMGHPIRYTAENG
jgi:hypothetical protein